jgi:hypothetical protein
VTSEVAEVVPADDVARLGASRQLERRALVSPPRRYSPRPADRCAPVLALRGRMVRSGGAAMCAMRGECMACSMQGMPGMTQRRPGRAHAVCAMCVAHGVPTVLVADRSAMADATYGSGQPMYLLLTDVSHMA